MKRFLSLVMVAVLLLGLAGCSLVDGCAVKDLTAEQLGRVSADALGKTVIAAHQAYGEVRPTLSAENQAWMTEHVGPVIDKARDASIAYAYLAELTTLMDQWRAAKAKALAEAAAIPPMSDYITAQKVSETILALAKAVGHAPEGDGEGLVTALIGQSDTIYNLAMKLLTEAMAAVEKSKAGESLTLLAAPVPA